MKSGDIVEENDTWFRVITNKDHFKNGRLHHAALKGKAISSTEAKAWKAELSGRLLSLAGDVFSIKADAERRVNLLRERAKQQGNSGNKFQFQGVMYQTAKKIRSFDFMQAGVVFTPTEEDKAHADLISYDRDAPFLISIAKEMVGRFKFSPTHRLQDLMSSSEEF